MHREASFDPSLYRDFLHFLTSFKLGPLENFPKRITTRFVSTILFSLCPSGSPLRFEPVSFYSLYDPPIVFVSRVIPPGFRLHPVFLTLALRPTLLSCLPTQKTPFSPLPSNSFRLFTLLLLPPLGFMFRIRTGISLPLSFLKILSFRIMAFFFLNRYPTLQKPPIPLPPLRTETPPPPCGSSSSYT